MSDNSELKNAAAAVPEWCTPPEAWDEDRNYSDGELAHIAFLSKATPAKVLSMLAEIEHLRAKVEESEQGKIMLSGCEFQQRELIERVVRNVKGPSKYRSKYGTARWVLVKGAFGVGSGVAIALCREFGFDPDEYLRS